VAAEMKNEEKTLRIIALESENYTVKNEIKNACADLETINLALNSPSLHKQQAG